MKKKILIASFDLAIGGVERSLIGLLNSLDYHQYDVDLMLFKHEGEFLPFLPNGPHLLPENEKYSTFRKSISQTAKSGQIPIAVARVLAKYYSEMKGKMSRITEPGYLTIQYAWEFSKPFLPSLKTEYDIAISFLWPHYFIAEKVQAKRKIGWVHTDYSNIHVDKKTDAEMWRKLDQIVAVSKDCSKTFLEQFPEMNDKTVVIENILSPQFVQQQAKEEAAEIRDWSNRTVLVTVGRLSHAKGIDDAVRACRKLVDKGYNISWYVVGYGPQEEDLETLIKELKLEDYFFLLGKKVNPYPYIKACDMYVQPSRYEGKAVTIREAQILGKAVVMTNFPTAKSQASDGVDALIAPQGVDGIEWGVEQLLNNAKLKESLEKNVQSMNFGNEAEIHKLYRLIEA